MSELNEQFEKALKDIKTLPSKPDNDVLLNLYSLYKQATSGDVSGDKPGFFDFAGVAKFEAWEALAGTSADDAKQKYIDTVNGLLG
jgi:acyl-CoA-binding protein